LAEAIRIEGLEQVKAALVAFDANLQDKAMRDALRAAGEVVRAEVEAVAPERVEQGGNSLPVGALRADIHLSVRKNDGMLAAIISPGSLTQHVARFVEYGHRLVKGGRSGVLASGKLKGPGRQVSSVPAHPFIRPAFEASIGEAMRAFASALKVSLMKGSK